MEKYMAAMQVTRRDGARRLARRITAGLIVAALLIGLTIAAVRVAEVHRQYNVWSWSPGAATPTFPFGGRTYIRGSAVSPNDVPASFVILGTAPGNGQIFGPTPVNGQTPTSILIRYPDGRVIGYALSGGP
jgi:hypothetical protein